MENNTKTQKIDEGMDEIRIVLIGKTNAGKSSLGNSMLQGNVFDCEASFASNTEDCLLRERSISSRNIHLKVLDTPGLFDTRHSNEEIQKKIVQCVTRLNPGPHIFVYALSAADRYTNIEQQAFTIIEKSFSEEMHNYMIVVFTKKDAVKDKPLDDWLREESQQQVKPLLGKCSNRYCGINNNSDEKQKDVECILDLIIKTKQENKSTFYTLDMLDKQHVECQVFMNELKEEQKMSKELREEIQKLKQLLASNEELQKTNKQLLEKNKDQKDEIDQLKSHVTKQGKTDEVSDEIIDHPVIADTYPPVAVEHPVSSTTDSASSVMGEVWSTTSSVHADNQLSTTKPVDQAFRLESYVFNKELRTERKRGRIPEHDVIKSNYIMLLDNIQPDRLSEALFEHGVIDEADVEQVRMMAPSGRGAVTSKLINIILNCGTGAFTKVITCLHQTGHGDVAKQLQSGNIQSININPVSSHRSEYIIRRKDVIVFWNPNKNCSSR